MITSLILLALGQSQLDKRVDLSCTARPIEQVLQQLSTDTGLKLRAAPPVSADVMVIHVTDVPVRELLGKISEAACAKWTTRGDTVTLDADYDVEKHQHLVMAREFSTRVKTALLELLGSRAYRVAWNQTVAQQFAKESEARPPGGRADQPHVDQLAGRNPIARASVSILATMGPNLIADHMDHRWTTYSDEPTTMQVGIPAIPEILNRFLTEQTELADATVAIRRAKGDPDNKGRFVVGANRSDFLRGDPSKGVSKVILTINGTYENPWFNADVTFLDQVKQVICEGGIHVSLGDRQLTSFDPKGDDSPIPVDDLSEQFRDVTRMDASNSNHFTMFMSAHLGKETKRLRFGTPDPVRSSRLTPAMLGWLSRPDLYDPLRLSAGSLLVASAVRREDKLVADLDDRCFNDGLKQFDGKTGPSQWLSSSALQMYHDVKEQGSWLVVSPRSVAAARKNRISRSGLTALIASLMKEKILTLDAISRFAQTQDAAPEGVSFDYSYLRLINPAAMVNNYSAASWPMYEFYGGMDEGQRSQIRSGKSLMFSSLSHPAQEGLRRLAFEHGGGERTVWGGDGKPIEPFMVGFVDDWTEALPDGIPQQTEVNVQVQSQPAAYCLSLTQDVASIRTAEDLAADRLVATSARYHQYASGIAYDRFGPATSYDYQFTFRFTASLGLKSELNDASFDDSAELVPLSEMPNELRNGIDGQLSELKQAFGKAMSGDASQIVPRP